MSKSFARRSVFPRLDINHKNYPGLKEILSVGRIEISVLCNVTKCHM